MSSSHTAKCPCGFVSFARVGGIRETYREESYFPFYCEACGMVNVNYRAKELVCSDCKSPNIKQYGKPPISLGETKNPMLQDFDLSAPAEGNLCPACKNMTLRFMPAFMRGH